MDSIRFKKMSDQLDGVCFAVLHLVLRILDIHAHH